MMDTIIKRIKILTWELSLIMGIDDDSIVVNRFHSFDNSVAVSLIRRTSRPQDPHSTTKCLNILYHCQNWSNPRACGDDDDLVWY